MKKSYSPPTTVSDTTLTACTLMAGSVFGSQVFDEPASSDAAVLARRRHSDVWYDEEEEE